MSRSPVDDLKTVVAREMETGWRDNPILVPLSLVETAKGIAADNNIPVQIEAVLWPEKKEA